MASDLEYVEHICDQLRSVGGVSYRKMFGEFALYVEGKVVALVCDNQLFVKPTETGRKLLGNPREGPPYPGAKDYFVADEYIDDRDLISSLILTTAAELPAVKTRKKGKTRRVTAEKERKRKS